ncbi:MAG: D-tyrosyl-tRNA(Tyr) deacylase [Pseudomonadota bacterium]|nr:MAG: D-tyrosyl-tRNA(Tyr) deacylase [Pseudomonadota bacterium]
MIALLQRVAEARVDVRGETIGAIGAGLLALIGVERDDGESQADRLLERMLAYRLFPDAQGRMNLSLRDIGGGLLLVPQFTLAADTNSGNRPSFTPAASPDEGKRLFVYLAARACERHHPTATGEFGADMQVALVNNGPVTFWLQVVPAPNSQ